MSLLYSRSRSSLPVCLIFIVSFALTACGGGGGGGGPDDGKGGGQTHTLKLGKPSSNPGVIPPAGSDTPVTFVSVVSGTAVPDQLSLDEVDSAGNLLARDLAYLMDNGEGADHYRGDRVYSGTLMVGSVNSEERHYRVRGDNDGQDVHSGIGKLWVSGCPVRARPSNPQLAVYDDRTGAYIFANEVMVTFKDGVAPVLEDINGIASQVTGRVVGCIPSLNQYLFEIEGDGTANGVYAAIDTLVLNAQVASATPNVKVVELPVGEASSCVGRECQWYLDRIRAPQAWAIAGAGDEQQGVAVIDFGVDCNHPELDCDSTVYNQDYIDHGTGVASLIGGNNRDNTDFAGVAWNTFLYPFGFLGRGGSQYKMSELITLSLGEDNVKVINISATTPIDPNGQIRDAICDAIDSGRLVVAAAGNAATEKSCELTDTFPGQYNSLGQCANGADLQAGLLVVGATDIDNGLAQWENDTRCSNTLYVDMFAPGKDIYTASVTDNYASKNGTSYAAPLVAGSAAVLWSAHPGLTVSQVHNQLVSASSHLSRQAVGPREQTSDARVEGQALLNMYRALGGSDTVDTPDTAPDPFGFNNQADVPFSELIASGAVTIGGLDTSTAIDVIGGYYAIDDGPFTNAAGTIANGQRLRLQVLSASAPTTVREVQVIVGGESAIFAVTTQAADNSPDNFDFLDSHNAPLNSIVTSNVLTISGINTDTPITIANGEYAIDGGAFTALPGTVNGTQSIQLRATSAGLPETVTTAVVTIGGVEDTFSVTTEAADVSPAPFSLGAVNNAALGSQQQSATITVNGINTPAPVSVSGGEYSVDGGTFTIDNSVVAAGQTLQVRRAGAHTPETATFTTLTVGTFSSTFAVTTLGADTTPDSFAFIDQSDVALGAEVISNAITVSGVNTAIPISITNGDYRINGGTFTNAAGQVSNGDMVEVRLTASAASATTVEATLTLGGISDTFSVSTVGANLPDSFAFADQLNVTPGASIESNTVTITGLTAPVAISVTGGEYRLDGGTYTVDSTTVANNQTVQVRQTAAASFSATTNLTLSIGGVSDTFSVTTMAADTTPDAFSFVDQAGVSLSTAITSNAITVSGINSQATITISNGAYSVNSGTFTAASGTVNNGDTVRVLMTSADTVETSVNATLTIGGVSDTFSVTTIAADTTPDAFSFTDQIDVAVSTTISSDTITISGINTATPISISGGEYAVNAGEFTSTASTVGNGQTVQVRQTSSANYSTTTDAVLTVGGVSDTFSVTTESNTAPTATNVTISGTAQVGNFLTGNYTYNDAESDEEGASTFQWLRNGSAISGATEQTYTLVEMDSGQSISFEVTPIAAFGITVGSAVMSNPVSVEVYSPLKMNITFPPPGTNYGGYTSPITVSGSITNNGNPVLNADIISVTVNGQVATLDSNKPGRWSVKVPVSLGTNLLSGEVVTIDDSTKTQQNLENEVVFENLQSLVYDAPNNRLIVANYHTDSIVIIDLASGASYVLSNDSLGTGPGLMSPAAIALDSANNRVLVIDDHGLYGVDLDNGNRTTIADDSTGTGIGFISLNAKDIALDVANDRVLAVRYNELYSIDLNSGDRELLVDSAGFSGGFGSFYLWKLDLDIPNNRAIIISRSSDTADPFGIVFQVNLDTNEVTRISDVNRGIGPSFGKIEFVALDPNIQNNRVIVASNSPDSPYDDEYYAVDLTTGDRSFLFSVPDGDLYSGLSTIDFQQNRILGFSERTGLTATDLSDGTGQILFSLNDSDRFHLIWSSVNIDHLNNRILFIDHGRDALIALDLLTGVSAILSDDNIGTGESLSDVDSFALDGQNNRAVGTKISDDVLSIDLSTGDRTLINVTGVSVLAACGTAMNPNSGGLLISSAETSGSALLEVDIAIGVSSYLSSPTVGRGPLLDTLNTSPVVDATNNIAYLANETQLFGIDLGNGDRRVIYDSNLADVWVSPASLALDSGSDRIFVRGAGAYLAPGFDYSFSKSLIAIGLSNASPFIVSGLGVGNGAQLGVGGWDKKMVFDDINNRLITQSNHGLLFIDVSSGDRVIMTNYYFQN